MYPWTWHLYAFKGAHLVLNLRAMATKEGSNQAWLETLSAQYWFHPGSSELDPSMGPISYISA